MRVVSVAQMRSAEAWCDARGLTGPALMEVAGRAIADALLAHPRSRDARAFVVLVGPGNNGGDGLVAARWLARRGRQVCAILSRARTGSALVDLVNESGGTTLVCGDGIDSALLAREMDRADILVDALLGIGQRREAPVTGPVASLLALATSSGRPVAAVDLPSGLDADSGRADERTPRCAVTLTLGAVKRGLLIGEGPERAGEVVVCDIAVPEGAWPVDAPVALDAAMARRLLPPRPSDGHKGTFGHVLVIGGSAQYRGAPVLAGRAALRVGAGLATIAYPAEVAIAASPELIHLPLEESSEPLRAAANTGTYRAIVIGPGLGQSDRAVSILDDALGSESLRHAAPWVIDADALNILARRDRWWDLLPEGRVLTPHPGEMARLLGRPLPADRIGVARDAAEAWRCCLVLKGANTIVACPGRVAISLVANPLLATGGTGDVLAGAIAGLLAQGLRTPEAMALAVYMHARAGQILAERYGDSGGLAGEVADALSVARRELAGIER